MHNEAFKEEAQTGDTVHDTDRQRESTMSESGMNNKASKKGVQTGETIHDTDRQPESTMRESGMNNKASKEGVQTGETVHDTDRQPENTMSESGMNNKASKEGVQTGETVHDTDRQPESTMSEPGMDKNSSKEDTQTGETVNDTDRQSESTASESSMDNTVSKEDTQTGETAQDTDIQPESTVRESGMDTKDLKELPIEASSSQSNEGQNQKYEGQNQNEQGTNSQLYPKNKTRSGGTKGSPVDQGICILTQEKGAQHPDQNHASDVGQAQQACDKKRYGKRPSVKDAEVQCGKDVTHERSDTKSPTCYPHKALVNCCRYGDRLPLFIATIAIAIALYTHICLTQHHNPENGEHFHEPIEFREKLSERLSIVESSVEEIKHFKFRLEGIEEKIQKLDLVAYKADIVDLVGKEYLENLVKDIKTDLLGHIDVNREDTNTVLQGEVLKLKAEVDGINEKLGNESQYLEKKHLDVLTEMSKLQTNVQTLKVEFGEQSTSQEKKNDEVAMQLSQHNEILIGLKQSEEKLGDRIKNISIETTVLNKAIEYIKENIFNKGSMTVVILIITSLLVLVIIYLVATKDTNRHANMNVDIEHQQRNNAVNQNPSPYSTAGRILSRVQAQHRLERKLCIISFYEETHPLHMGMTQSVTQQLNLELVEFIIRRHEDILEIPPVVLYFFFVDFNERNVILEDPSLGLGDLRLTTVQVIQKMRGKIVIFYVKDPNSRQLDSRILYNKNLASVRKQRELSALNRISRFISSYDCLTDFQIAHLRQIVENELDDC